MARSRQAPARETKRQAPAREASKSGIIAYAKIFPSIGIARVGNSPDEFFYGPEFHPPGTGKPADFRYRDAEGRIKRQAARFRVYGFDAQDRVVCELTSERATINWKVHLANKKAAWFEFRGAAKAALQFANAEEALTHPKRNGAAENGAIRRNPHSNRFESDDTRKAFEIDGGEKSISGADQRPAADPDGDRYRFKGCFKRGLNGYAGHEVYLGELHTDEQGRLVVLGGRGVSEPVGPGGPVSGDDRLGYWIVNYANNDHWHDDVSDGPVTAQVVLNDGTEVRVDGGAWVLVAPPDFAPDITNLMTLYDVMEEAAIAGPLPSTPGCPPLRGLDSVSFHEDIVPILSRMNDYRWVSPLGLRGHGYRKPGAAGPEVFSPGSGDDDPTRKAGELQTRERFFNVLRVPAYAGLDPQTGKPAEVDRALAAAQATTFYMPPLSGDEGDRTSGAPETWLTLTRLQYARMERWKDGDFTTDGAPPDAAGGTPPELQQQPGRLTRSALEACVGGPFYPGIEMTAIAREPTLFAEPFRIDHSRVGAGDISKYMACPWQADFYECRDAWWPAQRPDEVITDLTFEELFKSFEAERQSGFEAVMFRRERWDRGLERKPRPSRDALVNELLPPPKSDDAGEYAERIAARATALLFGLGGAAGYLDYVTDRLQAGTEAERLLNPWRLQYQTQEQLDGYSGRYFLPAVPSPEQAIDLDDLPPEFRSIPGTSNLSDIRRNWTTLRVTHPAFVGHVAGTYAAKMRSALHDYILDVVLHTPMPLGADDGARQTTPALQIKFNLENASSDPSSEPQEFAEDSDAYRRLRGGEFMDQLVSRLFLRRSVQAPDMRMVDEWRSLGFLRRKTIPGDEARDIPAITIQIETERDKYSGRSFRDYFYYLLNIEEFPDFLPFARVIAKRFLDAAQALIDETSIFDPNHPETFVPYTPENFAAKTEQIYEILRSQADDLQQYVYRNTRGERVQGILGNAPFNQTDGAWLRYAANAATIDEVTSLLFAVWSDEIGNGDPSLHHGNLYTALLKSLGVYLPEVTSRAYVDDPRLDETTFIAPVFQLAISQHSQEFFPEIIGMTLFLEWEVLSLVPGIKRLDYFGIDSQFWRMHVGIDNATEGHGAKAKRAIELYLDQVFRESGPQSQQEHWKRIWRGFVAFATAGYDLFQNVPDAMSIASERASHARTPADRVADVIERKLHYGNLNHLRNRLGLYRINDLFDDRSLFLEELANSPWVAPGRPEESRFLSYLTTFQGPMYKIFSPEDIAAWREWIEWLGREGDTARPKRHITRADAMVLLLVELRQLMIASPGHRVYRVPTKNDDDGRGAALADLFMSHDVREVMRVLKDPRNGWIVPFRPAESVLIVDLMQPARTMGSALDRRLPRLFGMVGRMVAYEWIAAGCPMPGEPVPDASRTIVPRRREAKLFVQQYGMGAVH